MANKCHRSNHPGKEKERREVPNGPYWSSKSRDPFWWLICIWATHTKRRQFFLFQPAKILEEKEGGVQFPNPQIGPDSLCVHQATLPNQRPHISNGSQSRRSKIASAASSVRRSFSNMELQWTNRIEWAWSLETNLSHFCILHKKWFSQSTRLC